MHATATGTPPEVKTRGRIPDRTVLLVASFGAFLAFLDATIVNVAFPNIRESFPDSTISSLSWILNAYSIVFAAFLVVSGRLADLVGRRRTFTNGVLIFTIASVLCAVAPSVEILIAFRLLQALGAALLVPASLALVVEAFPAEKRSHAVGLWGAAAALAAGLGPPIGGALVEWGDWRWAFLVNLPFGLAALWAGRRLLVESRAPGHRRLPDLLGATCRRSCWALLTLGIIKGGDWGWTSPATIACFVAAAVLLAVFVVSSRRHRSPLIDPALLRVRPFVVGNVATIVAGVGFYAYLLTNILWLQYVWGYSILAVGPRRRARGARRGDPGLAPRPDRAEARLPQGHRAGRDHLGARLPLVRPPGRGHPGLLGRLAPGPDPLGHRRRGDAAAFSAAPRSGPSRAVGSPPPPRSTRAPARSAASWASRSWSSSSGRRRPPPPSTACGTGWVFSAACFAVTAVVAVFIGRVRAQRGGSRGRRLDPATGHLGSRRRGCRRTVVVGSGACTAAVATARRRPHPARGGGRSGRRCPPARCCSRRATRRTTSTCSRRACSTSSRAAR